MKNYKNLAEKIKSMKWKCDGENGCGYDGTNEDTQYLCGGPVTMKGLQLHQIIRVRNLALEELLDSLPDQEPKDVPEVSRKAFTCRHDFKIFDELDEESIAVYCNKCGTTIDGAKLILPAAYAQYGIHPNDTEKCTENGHKDCFCGLKPQEPKECEHNGTKYDPSKLPWQCQDCGEDLSFKGLTYAKDLPKLPEKLDIRQGNVIGEDSKGKSVTMGYHFEELAKGFNQILDYLKNKN